jgi:hypothetical protein
LAPVFKIKNLNRICLKYMTTISMVKWNISDIGG